MYRLILRDRVVFNTLTFQEKHSGTVIDALSKMTFYFLQQENSMSLISMIYIKLKHTKFGYFIYISLFFPRLEAYNLMFIPHIQNVGFNISVFFL